MAIFVALRSPEVELLGLTTIFGNVYTTLATRNALHLVGFASLSILIFLGIHIHLNLILPIPNHPQPVSASSSSSNTTVVFVLFQLEAVGRTDIPVAEGSHVTIKVSQCHLPLQSTTTCSFFSAA
jgi:hypothetical protein